MALSIHASTQPQEGSTMIEFVRDDGGRALAGYKGLAGDCVVRSFAIATGRPYKEIYDLVNELGAQERSSKKRTRKSSARTGVHTPTQRKLGALLGFTWTPTMAIGSGTTVHLREDELPDGRLVVRLSGHTAAVINGVLHDTYDCSRAGERCVYGIWSKP
jgi:hypothetical protein